MVAYFDHIKVIFNHYFQFGSFDTIYPRHSPKKPQSQGNGLENSNTVTGRRDVNYLQPGAKKSSLIYLRRETRVWRGESRVPHLDMRSDTRGG